MSIPKRILRPLRILTFQNRLPSFQYKQLTTEVCRIDHNVIRQLFEQHPLILEPVVKWKNNATLKQTRHFVSDRLNKYLGQPSRNGQYMELYPEEFNFLQALDVNYPHLVQNTDIVEIGFNANDQVCKVGLVMELNPFVRYNQPVPTRYLFLCLGLDCGIKTIYVTPFFKDNDVYNGAKYLSLSEVKEKYLQ